MYKLLFVSAMLIFFTNTVNGQAWQWAEKGGGTHNEYAGDIDIDAHGNSYITGKFYNSVSFGAYTLNSPGSWAIYIAKYDVNGTVLWARIAGTAADIKATGICVDASGYISLTGLYLDSASFGDANPVPVYAVAGYDIFIAHYTPMGDLSWVRSAGEQGYDYSSSISHDGQGNLFITGEFHISAYNMSAAKVFVAKYDSSGNNTWFTMAQHYGNFHQGNDLCTGTGGISYVTGQFFDTLFFDPIHALGAGNIEANIFILKVDSSGNIVWMQSAGAASGYTSSNAIGMDAAGSAYITGFYKGTVSFGALSLTGPAGLSYDVYLAKCNANGDFQWVNKATGPWNLDDAERISVGKAGDVYIAGNFQDSLTLDSITVYSPGQPDVFIAHTDSSGHFIWADECGGPAYDNIAGIKVNATGLYLTGDFKSTAHFGPVLSLTGDSSDIFTARLQDTASAMVKILPGRKNIVLFPDPAAAELCLSGVPVSSTYTIYDLRGRVAVSSKTTKANKVDISTLHPGLYFIRFLMDSGETVVLRFTKS